MTIAPEQRLIGRRELAQKLNCSERSLDRLRENGGIPRPMKLGGRKLCWRLTDVEAWIAADCPRAAEKEATPA